MHRFFTKYSINFLHIIYNEFHLLLPYWFHRTVPNTTYYSQEMSTTQCDITVTQLISSLLWLKVCLYICIYFTTYNKWPHKYPINPVTILHFFSPLFTVVISSALMWETLNITNLIFCSVMTSILLHTSM